MARPLSPPKAQGFWRPHRFARSMKGVGNFASFAKRELTEQDKMLEEVKRLVNEKSTPEALFEAAATALSQLPKHTWVGVYMVEGGDLVLKAWKGPQALGEPAVAPSVRGQQAGQPCRPRTELLD